MNLDKRLEVRYQTLVRSHMMANDLLSNGVKATLKANEAFAQTQASWRFFNNERCELPLLMEPILKLCKSQILELNQDYVLIAHDWSGLVYKTHTGKKDLYGITNKKHLGYELQSSLVLSDIHGGPIAPIAMNVVDDTKVLSTYQATKECKATHLEELSERIHHIESHIVQGKRCVHIIDREGDAVQFMRALEGKKWLTRCKGGNHVTHANASIRIDALAQQLSFNQAREIMYSGKKAEQHIAFVDVHVTRAAQVKKEDGKKKKVPGKAVEGRLIVSKIVDKEGKVISWWYLLTNITDVPIDKIALWYYWRWSIESFFKLLKTAGMHIESWQQETVDAIARRLLVACMACVCVWQIAEAKGAEASELRTLLVKLSGRQMKYGISFTRPALLAGLCSLLNTLDLLENYDIERLKSILRETLGEKTVLKL